MRKTFTPLMIFGIIWSSIVLISWFSFPDWSNVLGGLATLAGLTAVGVIAFLKDGYSFIKDWLEAKKIVDSDAAQVDNHNLHPDDDSQITNIRWNEKDQNLVNQYVNLCCEIEPKFSENKNEKAFLRYCISMGLARMVSGNIYLTQAGVLLFCRKQSFPHMNYHIDITYKDNENDLSQEFSASILESYFSVRDLLMPFTAEWREPKIRQNTGQESLFRFYPQTAIIEALVNLFIHRDYKNDDIAYITIFPDKIEFENPGRSLYPVEELLKTKVLLKPQYKRNPRLVQALRKTGLNQREGKGIVRIKEELKKNGSFQPNGDLGLLIENDSERDRFRLTIYKKLPPTKTDKTIDIRVPIVQSTIGLHQLPPAPVNFTGRAESLNNIITRFENNDSGAIGGIIGMGGIGKTALGLVAAHKLSEKYVDGQIFFNMRSSVSQNPISDAMRHVILSLEPSANIRTLDENALNAKYQSVLYGKRVLLFFDDIQYSEQLSLLSPPETCGVLFTSRTQISTPGLVSQRLDVFTESEAVRFLLNICPRIGNRALELAKICGYLPLALSLAGGFLQVNEDWTIDQYLTYISDSKRVLKSLTLDTDSNLVAAFQLSYNELKDDEKLFWQKISVFSSPFSRNAAAFIWELEDEDAHKFLSVFYRYSLLDYNSATERYTLHNLLKYYALQTISQEGIEYKIEDARKLYAEYCLQILQAADVLYLQGDNNVLQGLALLDSEWEHICSTQEWLGGNASKGGRIAEIAMIYPNAAVYCLDVRLTIKEKIKWLNDGLDAAKILQNKDFQSIYYGNLGNAYSELGDVDAAKRYYEQQLTIARNIGDTRSEGNALSNIGTAFASIGELEKAVEYYKSALLIAKKLSDIRNEGNILGNLGNTFISLGDINDALKHYESALLIARELGDKYNESNVLRNLGQTYTSLGELKRAADYYDTSILISRELGDQHGEVKSLSSLAGVFVTIGDLDQGIEHYLQASNLNSKLSNRAGLANSLNGLASTFAQKGELDKAIEYYEQSSQLNKEIGNRAGLANSLNGLASTFAQKGELDKAIEYYEQSSQLNKEIGNRAGQSLALGALASAYADKGESKKALDLYRQAELISKEIGDRIGQAKVLSGLASISTQLRQWDDAIRYQQEQLAISVQLNDFRGQEKALAGLAFAYSKQNKFEESIEHQLKVLDLNKKVNNPRGEAKAYGALAAAYTNKGDVDQAVKYFLMAKELNDDIHDIRGSVRSLGGLASIYYRQKEWRKAIEYLEQVLSLNRKTEDRLIHRTLYQLAVSYYQLNELEKAKQYIREAYKLAGDNDTAIARLHKELIND